MGTRLRVVHNDFGKLADSLQRDLAQVVEDTAQDVRTDAANASPDIMGLDQQWAVDHRGGPFRRVVHNREWRAVFYEDGTPFNAPTPMLRPALERGRGKFLARLRKVFGG